MCDIMRQSSRCFFEMLSRGVSSNVLRVYDLIGSVTQPGIGIDS